MSRPGGRVVVGVSGSLGSLTALHRAAAEARVRDADLCAVLAWEPPGGNIPHRGGPVPTSTAAWRSMAVDRLTEALDDAFGSAGPGVPLERIVVCGKPGAAWWRSPTGSRTCWSSGPVRAAGCTARCGRP